VTAEHMTGGDLDLSDVEVADPVEHDAGPEAGGRRRGRARRVKSRWPAIVVSLALVAFAGLAVWQYFAQYRVDHQANGLAARTVVEAATAGAVAVLSYSPETIDRDLAAAKSHLTGNFLTYYGKFTDQIMAPAAKQKAVATHASVVRAAVIEMHPDEAKVLVFLNQTTTSHDMPEPVDTASSVSVTLVKADGSWLISAFDPL
jgi:Mce-associated membrane protein